MGAFRLRTLRVASKSLIRHASSAGNELVHRQVVEPELAADDDSKRVIEAQLLGEKAIVAIRLPSVLFQAKFST